LRTWKQLNGAIEYIENNLRGKRNGPAKRGINIKNLTKNLSHENKQR